MKLFIPLLLLIFTNISLAQTAPDEQSVNPTGLRHDLLNNPWAIHFDLTRLTYESPSIQLSTSYRLNYRFGFESEINYYLPSTIDNETTRLDALHVSLSTKKPSWFVSGMGKIYWGDRRIQFLGFRLATGPTFMDLSRNVCIEGVPSTSGEICQCLKSEIRTKTVHKNRFFYSFRYGLDLPVTDRFRLSTFVDLTQFFYNKNTYENLDHVCEESWPVFDDVPKTDGIFQEFKDSYNQHYFSFGLKIGYAF